MFTPIQKDLTPVDGVTTQSQLEEIFSDESITNELATDFDEYINNNIEKLDVITEYIGVTANDFAYQMLALFFDPNTGTNDLKNGIYRDMVTEHAFKKSINYVYNRQEVGSKPIELDSKTLRVVRLEDFVRASTNFACFAIPDTTKQQRAEMALKYTVAFEDIFYYIITPVCVVGQDEIGAPIYKTIPYIVFDFLDNSAVAETSRLNVKHFPLIESPKHWTTDEAGGYYTPIHKKPTKNRGASKQPQNVLDILNSFQDQKYILAKHVNVSDYRTYVRAKQELKLCPSGNMTDTIEDKIDLTVKNTTSTFEFVTSFYSKYDGFYFDWQYDFRGRAYSTGYNINLQADKYKKAMLIPHADNFQSDCYHASSSQLQILKDLHDSII